MDEPVATTKASSGFFPRLVKSFQTVYQKFLDDATPFVYPRWGVMVVSLVGFLVRIYLLQGWFIVTYAEGIYLLNLFILFLSPKIDPAMLELDPDEDNSQGLPLKSDEAEFRPFVRRLPEFKFWLQAQRSVIMAFLATFFDMFNVPVFWPILVLYFFILFGVSMKQRILHMIKYKYLPFSHGKTRYKGKEDTGKVVAT